jgi:hypothetical protein
MAKINKSIKEKCLDFYLRTPVKCDFFIVGFCILIWHSLSNYFSFSIDSENNKLSEISAEIGTVLITIAGFILTIITIIVTFKNSIEPKKNESNNDLFYNSNFYPVTIKLLKNCVKLLLFLFLVIYIARLLYPISDIIMFYINFSALVFSVLVFMRFLLILKIIISFQVSK